MRHEIKNQQILSEGVSPVDDHGGQSQVTLRHDLVDALQSHHLGLHDGVSDGVKVCWTQTHRVKSFGSTVT